MKLSTIDSILAAMDGPCRALDFGILLHLRTAPELEGLRTGARSARNRYPASGSVIDGNRWVPTAVPGDGVTVCTSANAVQEFLARRLDPGKDAPIQQLVVTGDPDGKTLLMTRVHHAAADGSSVAMWLRHQLRVAAGFERPVLERSAFEPVPLRRHPSPVRKSPFGYRRPAEKLWTRSDRSTGSRCWLTIELPSSFRGADALATAALETLLEWNCAHGARSRRVGLWLPVNIRERQAKGFGNGTSRIRIYPRQSGSDSGNQSFGDKCRETRRQIRWGLKHGEWAIPQDSWLGGPLLKVYLNRPWADMGSSVFTCVENWGGHEDAAFQEIEKIECIGQLHRQHAVAMNGLSLGGKTWLTFTYDPGQWTCGDIRQFVDSYQEQIALAEEAVA